MGWPLSGDDHVVGTTWNEFVPFLEFPVELRKIVYATDSIEALNASSDVQYDTALGHFPTDQAALKVLYLVAIERQRTGET